MRRRRAVRLLAIARPRSDRPLSHPGSAARSFLSRFNQPEGYKDATVACANIASCSNKTTCAAGICTGAGLPEGCRGYTCAGGSYDPEVRIRAASEARGND